MARDDPDTAWATIARYDAAVATVRRFSEASGALRVVALVDSGDGRAAVTIEAAPGEPLTLTDAGATYEVPDELVERATPRPLDPPRPVPPSSWEVDAETGQVTGPPGAVTAMALGVRGLAEALGGRSVATADFESRGGVAVTFAARAGEPLVLAVGDQQFEMPL